jgi:uncharacterized protein YqgV (UPF0045/DUF77 family)
MFDLKYPRTNGDVINLDWILTIVKELQETVTRLEEEWATIKVLTPEEIERMINKSIEAYDTTIRRVIAQAKDAAVNESKAYANAQDAIIRNLIAITAEETLNAAKAYSVDLYNQMKDYVDSKLVEYNFMFSPVTGEWEDVRDVVTEIINTFHRDNSLTASEYDALQLTASDYDAYQLTALDYDFNGKTLLV